MLFVPKAPPPPPVEVEPKPPAPAVIVTEPPPKGFQTVAALQDIPDLIPPVDLTQRALDPRDFTGQGVEGGLAAGVVGGTGKVDVWAGGPAPDAIYEASTNDERFSPATVVSQPHPRYPKHLEAAGLQGRVLVEFVIDTSGHVEPGSVRSLESTHAAFEEAAQDAMLGSLFKPARLSGHPVRQLTRQSVRFRESRDALKEGRTMTTIAPMEVGGTPEVRTPMLAFLHGTHEQWLQEVRSVLDPTRSETAGIWLRWRATDYLNGLKRRFERERRAGYSLHERLNGQQASHLWAAGELVGQVLENMRHQVGLCHHVKQFSSLAVTLLSALEYWCREVEESLGPVRWGDVASDSRVLFEMITYDDILVGG